MFVIIPEELLSTTRKKMLLQKLQGQNKMFKRRLAQANNEKILTFSTQRQNGAFHVRAK